MSEGIKVFSVPYTRYSVQWVYKINELLTDAIGEENWRNYVIEDYWDQCSFVQFEIKESHLTTAVEACQGKVPPAFWGQVQLASRSTAGQNLQNVLDDLISASKRRNRRNDPTAKRLSYI